MNDQNHWEKQLRSLTPRRPSDKIHGRLFPRADRPAHTYRRRAEILSWLTPVAACVLTVLINLGGVNRRPTFSDAKDNTTYAETISLNGSSPSNVQQRFVLSRSDVNLQWNVWPNAHSERVTNFSAPSSSLESWGAAMTNR